MTRIFPVTVNLALDRMSLELLPALTSTGPGSMMNQAEEVGSDSHWGRSSKRLKIELEFLGARDYREALQLDEGRKPPS
jgi:hypothetical protein